ncbi:Succinate dehydrogenase assembly factor 3 [Trichinella spiralis]|uniref:Succinate dehydrogenase assembly factor 3 n=1 Tax=Trichinella spiralis TaxID=6334 RepID=A0ABR3K2B9_TRISP
MLLFKANTHVSSNVLLHSAITLGKGVQWLNNQLQISEIFSLEHITRDLYNSFINRKRLLTKAGLVVVHYNDELRC